jgi:hypothetical protein
MRERERVNEYGENKVREGRRDRNETGAKVKKGKA